MLSTLAFITPRQATLRESTAAIKWSPCFSMLRGIWGEGAGLVGRLRAAWERPVVGTYAILPCLILPYHMSSYLILILC